MILRNVVGILPFARRGMSVRVLGLCAADSCVRQVVQIDDQVIGWPGLRCYGVARGAHACAVFRVIEARSRPRPGGAYLYGLDVLKPWRGHRRGRDVGGALIQAAVAAAARLGLRTLDMEVRRPAARALALRMGAAPVSAPRLSFAGLLVSSAGEYQRLTIGIPRA